MFISYEKLPVYYFQDIRGGLTILTTYRPQRQMCISVCPYAEEIQKVTIEWAKEFNILQKDNSKKYEKQNIGYLASRVQPYDSFQDVRITSDFLLLTCMLDDYSDKVKNPKEFKEYSNKLINVLRNIDDYEVDPFINGWHNWWERARKGTPIEWQNRIIHSIDKCFESIIWEIENEFENYVPNIENYIEKRQHSGSVYICFDLVERGDATFVTANVRNKDFEELITSANKIANWTNDILSLKKEIDNGEIHNLVISVQKENDCTIEEALLNVKELTIEEIKKYSLLKNKLYENNKPFNSNIIKYISRVENAVRANYEWSLTTKRF
ncbi:hypothetical protein BU060_10545 [Staphylococcus succinus]|nr:hypothetical protein BU060_10545 [Staphylococcus succinus]